MILACHLRQKPWKLRSKASDQKKPAGVTRLFISCYLQICVQTVHRCDIIDPWRGTSTATSNPMTIYEQNGYRDRSDYLDSLREDYGEAVDILTSVLPASEDFDGLVTALEDMADDF
jgi:hypothetical protein